MKAQRCALVTGGNRGLGLERAGSSPGAGLLRVILTSRSSDGEGAAQRLAREGSAVSHRPLDVADASSVAALASDLGRDGVSIDVLVNNAGVSMNGFDGEVARRTLDVNFFGAMHVTDALLPRIPDGGNVVMVSSGLGELSCVAPALRAALLAPDIARTLTRLMRSFVHDVERGKHTQAGRPCPPTACRRWG